MDNKALENARAEYWRKVRAGEIPKAKRESRPPPYKKLIDAKCKDCQWDYIDGLRDCETPTCKLYLAMPYGKPEKERRKRKLEKKIEKGKEKREREKKKERI